MSVIDFPKNSISSISKFIFESLFSIGKQFVKSTFRFAVVAFTQYIEGGTRAQTFTWYIEGALAPKRSLEGHSRPILTRRYIAHQKANRGTLVQEEAVKGAHEFVPVVCGTFF